MSVRILEGIYGNKSGAVMICEQTMVAFGPVFDNAGEALRFLTWSRLNFSDTVQTAAADDLANRLLVFRNRIRG